MFNIKWVVLFSFFQIVKTSQRSSESKDIFYGSHERILEIIDNVFISLKIDAKFKKSKNIAEYFSMHNFIQDAVEKNEQVYQNIRRTLKTNLSNKTSILNVNEVIDKTIRKQQSVIFKELMKNNSKIRAIAKNVILKDFTELARDFHLKVNMSVANDIKSLASDFKNLHPISRNILQEAVSTIKKFPFMVSIHVRDFFTCAGTLLREDLVISAASCLAQFTSEDSDVTPLNVRVSSDYTDKNGELIPIADLIFHSDFNPSNLNHNLVIIRLKKPILLEKKALLKYDMIADDLPIHVEEVFYLGWGEKDINPHDYYDKEDQKLSYARLDVYDFMDCLNHFTRLYISDQQFCAGIFNESNGVCKNDIGGPAIVGDTLLGVISFSSPHCGHPGVPTVFTKIGFYAEWITSVFEAFPLDTQLEPKTDPSTHEDDSQGKSEDETNVVQKEGPKLQRRADPELNSTLKQTSSNDSLPNDAKNDTLKQTRKLDEPHPPEVTSLKTNLVPILRMLTEKQTNPTPSPDIKLPEPPSAADETTDKIDWIFVDNVFDKLLPVVKDPETSSLATPTQMITPVFPIKDASHISFTPFTQNAEDINYLYFDENNEDHKQSKSEYENDIHINAKGDLSYENEDDSKVEVVIKEFGTTKLFVLDKKKANARKSLAIIREKLSKHYPDVTTDWLTMISTT